MSRIPVTIGAYFPADYLLTVRRATKLIPVPNHTDSLHTCVTFLAMSNCAVLLRPTSSCFKFPTAPFIRSVTMRRSPPYTSLLDPTAVAMTSERSVAEVLLDYTWDEKRDEKMVVIRKVIESIVSLFKGLVS